MVGQVVIEAGGLAGLLVLSWASQGGLTSSLKARKWRR